MNTELGAAAADGPPDPTGSGSVGDLVVVLRQTKVWSGDRSVRELAARINRRRLTRSGSADGQVAVSTVGHCFNPRRQRLDYDLLVDLLAEMGLTVTQRHRWQRAYVRVRTAEVGPTVDITDHPPVTDGSVGRVADLARIRAGLTQGAVVVSGLPGVGKSWVASLAAQQWLDRTVDGRLFWVSMPASASGGDVLRGLLRALGVRGGSPDLAVRLAAAVGRKPTLIVLDGACETGPLVSVLRLPTTTRTLVTSRVRLHLSGGLANEVGQPGIGPTDDGAEILNLRIAPLGRRDSASVLLAAAGRTISGPKDRAALARVLDRCHGLPLLLRMVGTQLALRPGWGFRDDVRRLEQQPWTQLDGVLADVYRERSPAARTLLVAIAVTRARTIDTELAGNLLDTEIADLPTTEVLARRAFASSACTELADAGLTVFAGDGWRLHDLVGAFVQRRMQAEVPWREQAAQVSRQVHRLVEQLEGNEVPPDGPTGVLRDRILGLVAAAVEHDLDCELIAVASASWPLVQRRLGPDTGRRCQQSAALAAERLGERSARVTAGYRTGVCLYLLGDLPGATAQMMDAAHIAEEVGDPALIIRARNGLMGVAMAGGDLEAAVGHGQAALKLAGDEPSVIAPILANLGTATAELGDVGRALTLYRKAIRDFAVAGKAAEGAAVHHNIGNVLLKEHRWAEAAAEFAAAARVDDELGHQHNAACSRAGLGNALAGAGNAEAANRELATAVAIAEAQGVDRLWCCVLNYQGDAVALLGDAPAAAEKYRRARIAARRCWDSVEEAKADVGLRRIGYQDEDREPDAGGE